MKLALEKTMEHRHNKFYYRLTQLLSGIVSRTLFKCEVRRNELKGKKGPFVVIANHQAALDFTNLIGLTKEEMIFVISNAFYRSLPFKKIMDKIGVIPKQQFQTSLKDIRSIKSAVEQGEILVIYPAGLMCEDGLCTPIPHTTYQFLKWLGADVYMAKVSGTYFVAPKWSQKKRPGKTYVDVYKIFDKEELAELDMSEIIERTRRNLDFDAYREQEELRIKYRGGDNLEGLEYVLYKCPHCKSEHGMKAEKNKIFCTECGYAEESDEYGFLHKIGEIGEEIRYVSDWSKMIYSGVLEKLCSGGDVYMKLPCDLEVLYGGAGKWKDCGKCTVTLTREGFTLSNTLYERYADTLIRIDHFASLPFIPGDSFEIQHGNDVLRCHPKNQYDVMRVINNVKALYELDERNDPYDSVHSKK